MVGSGESDGRMRVDVVAVDGPDVLILSVVASADCALLLVGVVGGHVLEFLLFASVNMVLAVAMFSILSVNSSIAFKVALVYGYLCSNSGCPRLLSVVVRYSTWF